MNYGVSVDLAIRADALNVLAPLQYDGSNFQWINHATGWTSHAAAEVSRVIVHAMADGYRVSPQTVKEQLVRTSRKNRYLKDFVKSSGVVDENAFRASFTSAQ